MYEGNTFLSSGELTTGGKKFHQHTAILKGQSTITYIQENQKMVGKHNNEIEKHLMYNKPLILRVIHTPIDFFYDMTTLYICI